MQTDSDCVARGRYQSVYGHKRSGESDGTGIAHTDYSQRNAVLPPTCQDSASQASSPTPALFLCLQPLGSQMQKLNPQSLCGTNSWISISSRIQTPASSLMNRHHFCLQLSSELPLTPESTCPCPASHCVRSHLFCTWHEKVDHQERIP